MWFDMDVGPIKTVSIEMEGFREEGKCSCGAVEYELRRPPMFVHCCHCSWCQRESGSAFTVNALVETSNLRVSSGAITEVKIPSNSGKGQIIIRCAKCLVALWSHYGAADRKVAFVRVGTLCNANRFSPDIHIFTSTKLKWVNLDGGAPVVEEYYRRSEYWPDESIMRYKAAIEALQG